MLILAQPQLKEIWNLASVNKGKSLCKQEFEIFLSNTSQHWRTCQSSTELNCHKLRPRLIRLKMMINSTILPISKVHLALNLSKAPLFRALSLWISSIILLKKPSLLKPLISLLKLRFQTLQQAF